MSHCRRQSAPHATDPHTLNNRYTTSTSPDAWGITRYRPNDPNLRRMPASAILPATGASTWALGSHRCTLYIGLLTMNASVNASAATPPPASVVPQREKYGGRLISSSNRGRELRAVYNNKCPPAPSFSGWYPCSSTIPRVGNRDSSNRM